MSFINNVKTVVHSTTSNSATSINITKASAPFNNPPASGRITLMDSLTSPTKIEIIIYTGRTDNSTYWTLTGCTRASESTTASTWAASDHAIQAFTAGDAASFLTTNGDGSSLTGLNKSPVVTGGTVIITTVAEGSGSYSYNLGTDFADDNTADANLTYGLFSGTLPTGAVLPTQGNTAFTGTIPSIGATTAFNFVIEAEDEEGAKRLQSYQQTINTIAPTTTGGTVSINSVSEGASASYDVDTDFTFSGSSVFSAFSLQSGSLPAGLSLNTSTGVISGTASGVSSNTTYTFSIRATDADGDTTDQNYSWQVTIVIPTTTGGTVTITSVGEGASASYNVNTNFSFSAGSVFGAFSLQSGSLPSGLSLNTSSGVISGTSGNVSSNTTASFVIRGADAEGHTVDQSYQWTITNVVPTVTGGTVTISTVNEGVSASYDVDTNFTFSTGSVFSAFAVQSGSLPAGLSLNTSSGVISGTPSTVSSNTAYTFVIRGTDSDGDVVDQSYSWTINVVGLTATSGILTTGGYNEKTSYSLATSGQFTAGYGASISSYAKTDGALPSGTSLNTSTGAITGTLSDLGSTTTFLWVVRATGSDGDTADKTFRTVVTHIPVPVGQAAFTSAGTHSWTAPAYVTQVSVVCVGGGAVEAAGGLGWKNNINVSAGSSYTVLVGGSSQTAGSYFHSPNTVRGIGASGNTGGGYVGNGGGNGGNCPGGTYPGGGGAGGYNGNGGNGGSYGGHGQNGAGGGGAGGHGGAHGWAGGSGGGGVGLLGEGASGTRGGGGGGGGSGGGSGPAGNASGGVNPGGLYGGNDRNGAVRIIWGPNRAFPSTGTGNQ